MEFNSAINSLRRLRNVCLLYKKIFSFTENILPTKKELFRNTVSQESCDKLHLDDHAKNKLSIGRYT